MNIIATALKALFDFFCGDWRIFWGVVVTFVLIELVEHLTILTAFIPFSGIIYIIGISLSLVIALKYEMSKG
jgi:hypothetical protein